MNKAQVITGLVVGFMLGCMALLLLSFYITMKQAEAAKLLDKQIKHDLILTVKDTCSPVYPVVHAAIYNGKIVVECRLK